MEQSIFLILKKRKKLCYNKFRSNKYKFSYSTLLYGTRLIHRASLFIYGNTYNQRVTLLDHRGKTRDIFLFIHRMGGGGRTNKKLSSLYKIMKKFSNIFDLKHSCNIVKITKTILHNLLTFFQKILKTLLRSVTVCANSYQNLLETLPKHFFRIFLKCFRNIPKF